MTIAYGLIGLAMACVFWNVVASILICIELGKRGIKVNFVFIKALIPWYAHRYKNVTLQETGQVGPLFYHWLVSINGALLTAIAGIAALRM